MLMNSIEFYNLIKGSIGKLSFYKKVPIKLNDTQKENNLNKLTSEYLNMLIHKKSFGESVDLNNAFAFSRRHAKIDLSHSDYQIKLITIYYQIKSEESYQELLKIENDINFISWSDDNIIENIKKNHHE